MQMSPKTPHKRMEIKWMEPNADEEILDIRNITDQTYMIMDKKEFMAVCANLFCNNHSSFVNERDCNNCEFIEVCNPEFDAETAIYKLFYRTYKDIKYNGNKGQ